MTQSFNYKINAIDTDNANRKNMPKILYKVKLKREKLKNWKYTMRSCNRILSVKWKDKQDVHMTIKYKTVEKTTQWSNRTLKPNCIIEYKNGMIRIDRQDEILACFLIMRNKWKDIENFSFISSILVFLICTFYSTKWITEKNKSTLIIGGVKLLWTTLATFWTIYSFNIFFK